MSVICFLPCRKGSERVPKKNIKPFAEAANGLIEIKLNQLIQAELIDEIVLSTNDEEILEYASSINSPKLRIHKRKAELCSSSTSTDELVAHVVDLIPEGHILWTHVTSPFVTAKAYDKIIASYFTCLEDNYDSLMTTTPVHGFLWNDQEPINYDRTQEKWPRTQTIKPLHEVNSAAFIASSDIYKNLGDRIGARPFLYALNKIDSFDIDWPDDFAIAECIAKNKLISI